MSLTKEDQSDNVVLEGAIYSDNRKWDHLEEDREVRIGLEK